MNVKILLADDHGLFRDSMSLWLKQLNDAVTFEFAESYQEVEDLIQSSDNFSLIILDLDMPGMQGILSIKKLSIDAESTPLLIVSADNTPESIEASKSAGVSGYVTKSSSGDVINQAVKTVLEGGLFFPKVTHSVISLNLESFTSRQQQLLPLLAEGKSNREMAEILFLSETTIKQYVSQIFRTLDVTNRSRAGIKARELLRIT